MTNQLNKQNKKLHTAITAGFLGVVVLVGVFALYEDSTEPAKAAETVQQNESASFTINTTPVDATVDSLSRTTGGGTIYEGEPFQIEWSTSDANYQSGQVTRSGAWGSGAVSANGSRSVSESTAGTHSYSIQAHNVEGDQTDSRSINVTVEERPESYNLSLTYPGVDIDGVPGSTARQNVRIDGENGFSGDVDLSVVDIPSSLKDDNGNNKVSFTFDDSTISGDGTTDLNMEVIQAIDESVSPMITVRSEDSSGNAQNPNQEETFRLNVDAFSPRTIEEF